MQVGVRELKARLSEYLSTVSAGAAVVVTDRGKPIARIVPIDEVSDLERGIESGWVEPPKRTALAEPLLLTGSRPSGDAIDDDRGD